jgi:hypothetical protein
VTDRRVDAAIERQRQLASAGDSVGDWTDAPLRRRPYEKPAVIASVTLDDDVTPSGVTGGA